MEVFRRVLQHYGGNNLPEQEFLSNTLHQTFGVEPKFHAEFVDLFTKNCLFLGIGAQFTSGATGELPASMVTGDPATTVLATGGSVTVATPDQPEGALVLFVIMPFSERDEGRTPGFFDEVLNHIFIPAGKAAGFKVRTAKRVGSDVIQSTIVNDLLQADLVLADLTEHNPNVLFELGMRCTSIFRWRLSGHAERVRSST